MNCSSWSISWKKLLKKVSRKLHNSVQKEKLRNDFYVLQFNGFILGYENPTSRVIYEHCNQLVEQLSRIGFVVIAIATPVSYVLPKAIISYFKYFSTDLEDEAFELPLFYWWMPLYNFCNHANEPNFIPLNVQKVPVWLATPNRLLCCCHSTVHTNRLSLYVCCMWGYIRRWTFRFYTFIHRGH